MWTLICGNSCVETQRFWGEASHRQWMVPPLVWSPLCPPSLAHSPFWKCENSVPSFPQIRIAVCDKKLCDSKFPFHNLVVRVETWNIETFICLWVKAFDLLRRFHIRWVLKCIRRSRTGGWRWMGQYQKAPWRLTSDFCQMGMCVWLYSSYVISSQ